MNNLTTGFHRLGLFLAGCLAAAIIALFGFFAMVDGKIVVAFLGVLIAAIVGGVAYALCRTIGWVVDGFKNGGRATR